MTGNSITHSRGERSGSDQYMEDGDTETETQIKKNSPCRSVVLTLSQKVSGRVKQTHLDPGKLSSQWQEHLIAKAYYSGCWQVNKSIHLVCQHVERKHEICSISQYSSGEVALICPDYKVTSIQYLLVQIAKSQLKAIEYGRPQKRAKSCKNRTLTMKVSKCKSLQVKCEYLVLMSLQFLFFS